MNEVGLPDSSETEAADPVGGYRIGMEDGCIEHHTFKPPCELASGNPGSWNSDTMGTTG